MNTAHKLSPHTLPREKCLPGDVMGLRLVLLSRTDLTSTYTFWAGCRSVRQAGTMAGALYMLAIVVTCAKGGHRPSWRRYPERPRDVLKAWPPNVKMRHFVKISRKISIVCIEHTINATNFEVT